MMNTSATFITPLGNILRVGTLRHGKNTHPPLSNAIFPIPATADEYIYIKTRMFLLRKQIQIEMTSSA